MAFLIFSAIVVLLDQITKFIVKTRMNPYESFPVINPILYITYVKNRGAAFSLLEGNIPFLAIVSLIVNLFILFLLIKGIKSSKTTKFSLALILGGSIGNFLDRIRLGYVVDFIDLRVWPVFNVADMAVVFGVLILSYILIFEKDEIKLF